MFWKVLGNTALADICRCLAHQVLPSRTMGAGIRLIHTGQQVEHRRFAGAVGADEAIQLPFLNGNIKIIDGLQTTEGNTLNFLHSTIPCLLTRLLFIAGKSLQQALLKPGLVKEHHRDQDDGVQKHTKVIGAAQHLRQNRQDNCCNDGTADAAHAAQDDDNKNLDRFVVVEGGGLDDTNVMCIKDTGHACEKCRDHKCHDLEAAHMNADGFCRDVVVTDRAYGTAMAAVHNIRNHKDRDHCHDKYQRIMLIIGNQRDLGKALGTVGERHTVQDRFDDLTKCQRHDGQIVSPADEAPVPR